MLKPTTFSIECDALLSSEQVLGECIDYLRRHNGSLRTEGGSIAFGANTSTTASEHALSEFRHNWMEDEVDLRTKQLYNKASGLPNYTQTLSSLFDMFYELDGYNIINKDKMHEESSAIARTVDPFCIGAWKLSTLLNNPHDLDALNIAIQNIRPNLYDGRKLQEELAENHMHFNGAHPVPANLAAIIADRTYHSFSLKSTPKNVSKGVYTLDKLLKLLKVISSSINDYAWSNIVSNTTSPMFHESISRELNNLINKGWNFSNRSGMMYLKDFDQYNFHSINSITHCDESSSRSLLALSAGLLSSSQYTASWLAYLTFIFRLYHVTNSQHLKIAICAFLHCANCVRRYMVMSNGRGLEDFVRFFDVPCRNEMVHITDNIQTRTTRHLLRSGATSIDFKVATFSNTDKNKLIKSSTALCSKVLRGFIEHSIHGDDPHASSNNLPIITETRIDKYLNSNSEFHFSQHFIKTGDNTKFPDWQSRLIPPRHDLKRRELYKQAKMMHLWRSSPSRITNLHEMLRQSGISLAELLQINKNSLYFDPATTMRTLDAAGDERKIQPEVFAPIFRYLRSSTLHTLNNQPTTTAYRARPPRLSYHVGESFSCLMTGLRRIDEAIRFMEFKEGDRLGHALALGINPTMWLNRSGEFTIPKEEALDNAVWLWSCACKLSRIAPQIGSFWVSYYLDQAIKLGSEIYSECLHIYELYAAWKLRRNCPDTFFETENRLSYYMTNIEPLIPDAKNFKQSKPSELSLQQRAKELFRRYHYDKEVRDNGKVQCHFRFDEHYSHIEGTGITYITAKELDFWEAVQDYMISKISCIGIIIETNPSSNIYIADFTSVEDHPIFRFNPPKIKHLKNGKRYNKFGIRNGALRVCVNTDDPSVFNTTLPNEFILLADTAKRVFDMNDEEIYPWIQRLKKIGLEVFDSTHIDPWFTM